MEKTEGIRASGSPRLDRAKLAGGAVVSGRDGLLRLHRQLAEAHREAILEPERALWHDAMLAVDAAVADVDRALKDVSQLIGNAELGL